MYERMSRRWALIVATLFGVTPALGQAVQKPTHATPKGGCVTSECHPGIKAHKFTHGPVGVGECDACHKETDAAKHTFALEREGADLCTYCHDLELDLKYKHPPAAEGQCLVCHRPHGGDDRYMLQDETVGAVCLECHDDPTEDLPVVHGPVAAEACTACHRPHASDYAKLLVRPGRELCLECHEAIKERLEDVRTVHEPAKTECTACHRPHAAEQKMLLADKTLDLCLGCHTKIEDVIDEATVKHEPVSNDLACRNCHDPHGSDYAAILVNKMEDVCLTCHNREIELKDGTKLANMQEVLSGKKHLHGPVAQGNCAACHNAHGGTIFRLLIEQYPPDFYAPFDEESYALCFSCHDSEAMLDEETEDATDFRNGDRNLHYLHVNRETRGRTCRACHEVHASTQPKQIRDSVPFGAGGWKLPINYTKTDTGGRCSPGCHRPLAYDRDKPVSYALPGEASPSSKQP